MVIVIINLRGLFMSVAYEKKKKEKKKRRRGRKKTIGEGAMSEKKIGNRGGEGKILSQASVEKFREFTCVNQSMDDGLG